MTQWGDAVIESVGPSRLRLYAVFCAVLSFSALDRLAGL